MPHEKSDILKGGGPFLYPKSLTIFKGLLEILHYFKLENYLIF
jgi:hypothetical protein